MSELETFEDQMKVLAIKVYSKQAKILEEFTLAGLYSSKSEILRGAAWDLLQMVNQSKSTEKSDQKNIKPFQEINEIFVSPTKSICSKIPLKLLTSIDFIVNQRYFKNRSEFFRVALSSYLTSDSEIFSHYLK
ncbi:MAG: ribbon-helix-helix domain-containing protein [Candidatus Thorarchaeota archaeon]